MVVDGSDEMIIRDVDLVQWMMTCGLRARSSRQPGAS